MDAQLTPAQVRAIIRRQFPSMSASSVVPLGEGCDSSAFEVDGEWVFRFPKRADVEAQLGIESRVLPMLARQSPLPVPSFSFYGQPCEIFPHRFVGYRTLQGVPVMQIDPDALPIERWVPPTGRFLSWLHSVPPADAEQMGVAHLDVSGVLAELTADTLESLHLLDSVTSAADATHWRAFFESGPPTPALTSAPVVVHGDLAAEHVLWDERQQEVSGIIDWSEVAISDPSVDLAAFFHWGGERCAEVALSVYDRPVDDDALERAKFLAACRGVADVAFGLETGRRTYVEAGIRALSLR